MYSEKEEMDELEEWPVLPNVDFQNLRITVEQRQILINNLKRESLYQ